jgi:L-alanine-DL-glutamate epimerase-like enolase superfamily enzyme
MIAALRIGHFESPMRVRFKHASAFRTRTQNVIVALRDENGLCGYGEGCPREYVTGETQASAKTFLAEHGPAALTALGSVADLRRWIDEHEALIDANPAAFCAFDLAALDLLGKRAGMTLEQLLGLPPLLQPVGYTAVMGDSSPSKAWAMSLAYRIWGFSDFKVKVSGDPARDWARFRTLPRNARIRLDANNLWQTAEECIRHFQNLDRDIWAIEEPVQAEDTASLRKIAEALGVKIILDESMTRRSQIARYKADAENWIANIRVSKCGGILRSIRLGQEVQAAGMGITLGAQVGETSLLTRAALTVGQSLSPPALAREGAYGRFLLKRDLTEPSLRFQIGGNLAPSRFNLTARAGLGLNVVESAITWS